MNRVVMIDTVARKKLFKESEQVIGEIVESMITRIRSSSVYESSTPEMYRGEDGDPLCRDHLLR